MRTNTEIAYEMIKKKKRPFKEIVDKLVKENEFKMEDIGKLYSDLILDGRFFQLEGNVWDLASKHTYDEIHSKVEIIEDDEEDEELDEELEKDTSNKNDDDDEDDEDEDNLEELKKNLVDVGDLEEE